MTQNYSQSDLVNFDLRDLLICQTVKSVFLFRFMESHNSETQLILTLFCDFFGASSWREYLINYLPISHAIFRREIPDQFIELDISDSEDKEKHADFFEKISIYDETELADYDFLSIREKPIFKVDENKYKIIFPLFAIEKIFQGLYFLMARINNQNKIIGNFKSFYCDEFSENYLVYGILDMVFPKKFVKIRGEEAKMLGQVSEPDYYVRNKNKIFLFEAKDVLVKAEVKQSNDYNQLVQVLKEKFYYHENKKGKRENKAVLQLIGNIEKLLTNDLKYDSVKPEHIRIYPILLVHYKQYSSLGVNKIVIDWFKDELNLLKEKGLDVSKVKDVVIIDIDYFILFQNSLKTRSMRFEDVLDDYLKFIDLDNVHSIRSISQRHTKIIESVISFYQFVMGNLKYRKMLKLPDIYNKSALNIFEK